MTAMTTVMGAVPLVLSAGPGHEARTVIGIVVMCGVAVATLITLVLIPMAYVLFARDTGSPQQVSRRLETEMSEADSAALPDAGLSDSHKRS